MTNFLHQFSPHEREYLRMCQKSTPEYRICHRDSMIGSSNEHFRWWSRWVCLERIWKQTIEIRLKSRVEKLSIKKVSMTHLISISLDLMSPIEFPMNDICSSLTPDKDTLIHLNMGTDDKSACKNCGSTRCFLFRSKTDTPSILIWLIVDDFNAFEIALNVLAASSRWIIQLQIFNVFRSLWMRGEEKKF